MSYLELANNVNKLRSLINKMKKGNKNTRKLHSKIIKTVIKVRKHLEKISDIIWHEDTRLSTRLKILRESDIYIDYIGQDIITLYKYNIIDIEHVSNFARLIGNLGKFDMVEKMLINILGQEETYSNLATLSDLFFEIGMLEKSLEVMKKLGNIGIKFFETYYNSILILYFMGRDLEALEMINEVDKKFGEVPQLTGLKIALYISNNDINKANEINKRRRGLI